MKLKPLLLTVLFFLAHCSFDNKTGIWKDASIIGVEQDNDKDIKDIEVNKKDFDKNFTRIFTEESQFNNAKKVEPGTLIALNNPINIKNWLETYYNSENNPSNIFYKNNKKNIFKSKSLAKFPNKIKNNYNKLTHPLFYKNKIISYDHKGTVYIYSIETKKKILTYNFYKKKFKKIEKKLFFLIKNDIIYVADNLGYLYAININSSKLIWAKNYGVPFRSNIKSNIDTLFLANLDNVIFAVNVSNGKKKWQFATKVNQLNSDFINNLIIDEVNRNIIFFNTSGEVYSINYTTKRINWVLNLKSSSTTGQNRLFLANPMVINDNDIIISSDSALLSYNKITGNTNWQIPITVSPKLDISNNFIFGYTDNKLLTCLKTNGDILWSTKIFNLSSNISPKYDEDEIGTISSLVLANNNIMLFSSKGYLLEFNSKNGQIISINKISKNGFVTDPIFSEGNMMVFNSKYKLLIFN